MTVPSSTELKVCDGVFKSLGTLPVRIPTPDVSFLLMSMDVVEADVAMLIGIDALDRERIFADNVSNCLVQRDGRWKLPIARKLGHTYLEWSSKHVLWTKAEIIKLYSHFRHLSALESLISC